MSPRERQMPKILFLYFTYSQQTLAVVDAMAERLIERGCKIHKARIEFTEPRHAARFSFFPFRHVYLDLFAMLPAQLRRATGSFRMSEDLASEDYDMICIGSPTWWLTTCMPVRSFMKSDAARKLLRGKPFAAFAVCRRYWRNNLYTVRDLGVQQGGRFVKGTHFAHAGGQIRSLLSLISFLGKGEDRPHYLGVSIPSAGLKPDYRTEARSFADELVDHLRPAAG
jgi:hypothetical protein